MSRDSWARHEENNSDPYGRKIRAMTEELDARAKRIQSSGGSRASAIRKARSEMWAEGMSGSDLARAQANAEEHF